MKILYFHRNKNAGFSINKVFQSITETLPQYNISYKEKYIPSPNAKIKDIIQNGLFAFKQQKTNYTTQSHQQNNKRNHFPPESSLKPQ